MTQSGVVFVYQLSTALRSGITFDCPEEAILARRPRSAHGDAAQDHWHL
jgi:hypothetical protein